jgi:hypothetical protein
MMAVIRSTRDTAVERCLDGKMPPVMASVMPDRRPFMECTGSGSSENGPEVVVSRAGSGIDRQAINPVAL